jgi:diguanylate cyclase (GGDEF)-like protein
VPKEPAPRVPPTEETKAPGRSLPTDHWDSLFDAVTTTLRQAAAKPRLRDGLTEWPARETTVLECVRQLELLQEAVRDERRRSDGSRRMVAALQEALALARTGLLRQQAEGHLDPGIALLQGEGLFRGHLDEALALANGQKRAVAVLQLDLDGCEAIEDRHGRAVVDDVLTIVETRLTGTIRPTDTLARLGQERFACLLVDIPGREQLSHVACKLLDAAAEPLQVRNLQLNVRPSIGIATWHEGAPTADVLLRTADEALTRAKHDGLGYAFSDERAQAWAQWSESALGNSVS